jgi:hypothetical protein
MGRLLVATAVIGVLSSSLVLAQAPPAPKVATEEELKQEQLEMASKEAKFYQMLSQRQEVILLRTQQALNQREKDWAAYSEVLWQALEGKK